jgi:nucleoside-diphosphate-sugar epimerase
MNLLLTGATGFIGTVVYQQLQSLPQFRLRVALRKPYPAYPDGIIIGSINSQTDWSQALQGIDTVIHLAAYAHVTQPSRLDTAALYEINVFGTQNLIRQAIITAGVKHLIFISSIGAVTSLSPIPLTEKSPCHPNTPYGQSKLKAEQDLIELSQNTALTYTILRPPLIYGPGNPGNMKRLLKLVDSGVPLPLGGIKNSRSFLYVGNLVNAITTCITHSNASNQTFLVSDGEDLSTPDLICKIGQKMGKSPMLIPFPLRGLRGLAKLVERQDTLDRLTGSLAIDSSKIRTTLDWHPPFTLEEGLQDTVAWYLRQSD